MSFDSTSPESPPSYNDIDNELWEPTILVLAGVTVHAESGDSAPLYILNRAVASITQSTERVEFERVERTIKGSTDKPVVKPRSRHIYNLVYMKGPPGGLEFMPSESPHAYVQAVSRRVRIGSVGLKKTRFRSRVTALPIDTSGKNSKYAGLPSFHKDTKPLFQIQQKDGKNQWTDSDGNAVAVEDHGDGQHRFIITASLKRHTIDALVALWCCRIWQHSAENAKGLDEGMEGGEFLI